MYDRVCVIHQSQILHQNSAHLLRGSLSHLGHLIVVSIKVKLILFSYTLIWGHSLA